MIAIFNGVGRWKNEMGKILVDISIPNYGGLKSGGSFKLFTCRLFHSVEFNAVMQASDLQIFS